MGVSDKKLQIIKKAAKKHGIDPKILYGVFGTESGFGANMGPSSAGAVGPFQFLPSTAREVGINPNKFKSAAKGAATYLETLGGRDDINNALNRYSGGGGSTYINTVKGHAQDWPGAKGGGGGGSGGIKASKIKQGKDVFDKAGYAQAASFKNLAEIFAKHRGANNSLAKAGIFSTAEIDPASYVTKGQPKVKGGKGGGKGAGGSLKAGGGYSGTQKLVNQASKALGITPSNTKRGTRDTASGNVSDHFTGQKDAYAADYTVSGKDGDKIAKQLAKHFGINPKSVIGNWNNHYISVSGQKFRVQIGWQVPGHTTHLHLGIRAV